MSKLALVIAGVGALAIGALAFKAREDDDEASGPLPPPPPPRGTGYPPVPPVTVPPRWVPPPPAGMPPIYTDPNWGTISVPPQGWPIPGGNYIEGIGWCPPGMVYNLATQMCEPQFSTQGEPTTGACCDSCATGGACTGCK